MPPTADATIMGRVYSVRSEYASAIGRNGATAVIATRVDGQGVPYAAAASAGGAFTLNGLAAGSYTLTVHAGVALYPYTLVEGMGTTIQIQAGGTLHTSLGVVALCDPVRVPSGCPTAPHEALLVLQYDASQGDTLGLQLAFDLPPPSGQCQVNGARTACGASSWSAASDAWMCATPTCTTNVLDTFAGGYSCHARILWEEVLNSHPPLRACELAATAHAECAPCMPQSGLTNTPRTRAEVVTIQEWVSWQLPGGAKRYPAYLAFIASQPRLCHGYQLPSAAGTGAPLIDCIGNCRTGRGYCDAVGSTCQSCVLFPKQLQPGDVLCERPQGGPLPLTAEWDAGVANGTCGFVMPSPPPSNATDAPCTASERLWQRVNPRVSVISRAGTLVDTVETPVGVGADVGRFVPHDVASAACIQPASTRPILSTMPWRLLNLDAFVRTRAAGNCTGAAALVSAASEPPPARRNCTV